jgi:hypothetical protein
MPVHKIEPPEPATMHAWGHANHNEPQKMRNAPKLCLSLELAAAHVALALQEGSLILKD